MEEGLGKVSLDRAEQEEVDLRDREGGGSSAGSMAEAEGSWRDGIAKNMRAGEQ